MFDENVNLIQLVTWLFRASKLTPSVLPLKCLGDLKAKLVFFVDVMKSHPKLKEFTSVVVTPVTVHRLSVNNALRTTQLGTEQEADVIKAIRLLTDISSTNHNKKTVMPPICVAPEVPAGDTTVMYVEKQGGNLGYSISC